MTMMDEFVSFLAVELLSCVIAIGVVCAAVCFIKNRAATVAFGVVLVAFLVYHRECLQCKPWPVAPTMDESRLVIATALFITLFIAPYAVMIFLVFDSNFIAVVLLVWCPIAILTVAFNLLLCHAPGLALMF
jgi:hypothetical protein